MVRTITSTAKAKLEKARLPSTTREISRNIDSSEPVRRRSLSRSKSNPGATSSRNRRTDSQLPGTIR
jgi:hypothetical protein